jgi:tetratricopeptide (TPR) repeat protein
VIAAALAVWIAFAPADPREANQHYREAQAAWEAGRLDDAAAALERAYVQDPRPEYLFMQAELVRRQGRCEEALELYRRFIADDPPTEDVEAAKRSMAQCEEEMEPAPVPAPVVAPVVEPPPPPAPKPARRWIADPTGNALFWPGLAIAGVGAGLLGAAHRNRAAAAEAGSEPAYLDTLGPAPEMSEAGIALLSIGGALLLACTIRWAVVAGRSRRQLAKF